MKNRNKWMIGGMLLAALGIGLFLLSKQQLPLRKSIFHTQIPIRGLQLEWMAHHFA